MCGMHTAGTNTCSCAEVSILGHACAMLPRQQCEAQGNACASWAALLLCHCREAGLGIPRRSIPVQAAMPMVAWSMAGVWHHGGLLCALLGGQAGPTARGGGCNLQPPVPCCLAGCCCCNLAWPCMSGLATGLCHPLLLGQLQQPRGLMMPADDASR